MGNVEKILVIVIMATIVVILALAIWGLGQDETYKAGTDVAVQPDKEVPVVSAPSGGSADSDIEATLPVADGSPRTATGTGSKPIAEVAASPRTGSESSALASPVAGDVLDSPVAGMMRYTVKKGETYSVIAEKLLGDRNQWKAIADAN